VVVAICLLVVPLGTVAAVGTAETRRQTRLI